MGNIGQKNQEKVENMKLFRFWLFIILICLLASAETEFLGKYVYQNEEGLINLVADAGVAMRNLDSPYVMFVLYMWVDENVSATVNRNDVVMVYKGKEYKMPTVKELSENYKAEIRDTIMYQKLSKAALATSRVRHYRFPLFYDFFPDRTSGNLAVDHGFMTSFTGFSTRIYFKNPSFKMGDALTIKVKDEKDPEITGSVDIEFKD
jgi:hypothetical protein